MYRNDKKNCRSAVLRYDTPLSLLCFEQSALFVYITEDDKSSGEENDDSGHSSIEDDQSENIPVMENIQVSE